MAYTEVDGSSEVGSGTTIRCEQGALLTPAAGAITVTDSFHSINGGTLSTINGGKANSLYVLEADSDFTISAATNIRAYRSTVAAGEVLGLWFDGSDFVNLGAPVTVLDVRTFGAVGDGVTDDAAAIQSAIDSVTQNTTIFFPPTSAGYLCKSPLVVNKNYTALVGGEYLQTSLTSDLSAYVGSYPKYGIILGDSLTTPSYNVTVQGNAIRNIRINTIGADGGILAWRSTLSKIEAAIVTGTSLTYGMRVVASDSQFMIRDCAIGQAGSSSAPSIGISIENGSNQTHVESSNIGATSCCIQVFNCNGVWITRNSNISPWVSGAGSYYGVRIRNDQAVPSWVTPWLPASVGGNVHVTDNLFEPGDAAGATIYDVFVGDGVPTVHAVSGTVVRDNYFIGTANATRYPVYVDYADQSVVSTLTYYGSVTKLLNITSHANLTKYDLQTQSAFNTGATSDASLISDSGTKSCSMGHWRTPTFSAGNFTSDSGTWVVGSGDVSNFQYTVIHRKLSLNVYLVNTDVTGTPTELRIALPDGYTATKPVLILARLVNSGGLFTGIAYVSAGADHITVQKNDQSALAADAGGTGVQFQMDIEVS